MNRPNLMDFRRFLQFAQHALRRGVIHLDYRDCFAVSCASTAAQGKVGDIDFVAAKNGTYFAYYAWNVAIAHVDELTFQGDLYVDVVHSQQAQGRPMQNRPSYQSLV